MAKNKFTHIILVLLTMLCSLGLKAQSVNLSFTDGSSTSYILEDVRKITFDADVMNLHLFDGSVYAWNVSTIGYFDYNDNSVNIEEVLSLVNSWDVAIYPNPTNNLLNLRYILPKDDIITITLYNLQGKMLVEKQFGKQLIGEIQETIDLTPLPAGTYICKIAGQENTITKKVMKQ